ncbi:uncharacterized protein LOC131672980 isoform X2 [Phymastichus coffea]|nr:uncharacterized protein LOC131672980 isoform X2 [Phymastichus coffea]
MSMIRQHSREEGLFRRSGRGMLRDHVLDSLRKGERLRIANGPDSAKECAAALHLFLVQMKSPLIPRRVQQLLLADNPGIEAQMIAEDALGLIRQDVSGRQSELLRHLLELLRHLIINATLSQRADTRSPPLAVIFLPVFFNLSTIDIMEWRRIATRLNELIIEAPYHLNRQNKQSDAIDGGVAPDQTILMARLTLYDPLVRGDQNRNDDQVNDETRQYDRYLQRPLAGRLHPAILRVRT